MIADVMSYARSAGAVYPRRAVSAGDGASSALKRNLKVACGWARCCARKPTSTTRPRPTRISTSGAAARDPVAAELPAALQQPLARVRTRPPCAPAATSRPRRARAASSAPNARPLAKNADTSAGMPQASGLVVSTSRRSSEPGIENSVSRNAGEHVGDRQAERRQRQFRRAVERDQRAAGLDELVAAPRRRAGPRPPVYGCGHGRRRQARQQRLVRGIGQDQRVDATRRARRRGCRRRAA